MLWTLSVGAEMGTTFLRSDLVVIKPKIIQHIFFWNLCCRNASTWVQVHAGIITVVLYVMLTTWK